MQDLLNNASLRDSCVVITGVSGQLGRAYAAAFLAAGATVVGIDKVEADLTELLSSDTKNNFLFVHADVTNKVSLRSGLSQIQKEVGTPTILINNAAIDSPPSAPSSENGPYEEYPDESWGIEYSRSTCQEFIIVAKYLGEQWLLREEAPL